MGVGIEGTDAKAARSLLEKCAKTSLNSKLISRYQVRVLVALSTELLLHVQGGLLCVFSLTLAPLRRTFLRP